MSSESDDTKQAALAGEELKKALEHDTARKAAEGQENRKPYRPPAVRGVLLGGEEGVGAVEMLKEIGERLLTAHQSTVEYEKERERARQEENARLDAAERARKEQGDVRWRQHYRLCMAIELLAHRPTLPVETEAIRRDVRAALRCADIMLAEAEKPPEP